MPARRIPTSYTAKRPITLGGTAYAVGATITLANAALYLGRRLDAYVSRGYLSPTPTQYVKTALRSSGSSRHIHSTYLSPVERKATFG